IDVMRSPRRHRRLQYRISEDLREEEVFEPLPSLVPTRAFVRLRSVPSFPFARIDRRLVSRLTCGQWMSRLDASSGVPVERHGATKLDCYASSTPTAGRLQRNSISSNDLPHGSLHASRYSATRIAIYRN